MLVKFEVNTGRVTAEQNEIDAFALLMRAPIGSGLPSSTSLSAAAAKRSLVEFCMVAGVVIDLFSAPSLRLPYARLPHRNRSCPQ